jgi:O-antigen/teichoic acid export membrane protein
MESLKKNEKKSIKKNYFYNLLYQVFVLITPLITTPYISRILLADGVGKYSFSFSLITYFTLFGALGFGYYAQREIAKHQNNIISQSVVFWEINICRILPVSIALVTNLILYFLNIYGDYSVLMLILSINILAVGIDINFFFQGNEKFKTVVLRNFIIRVVAISSIFIFVKTSSHLWVFTLINSLSVFLSACSMWIPVRKAIVKVDFRSLKPFKHLKGTLILFVPTIAASIYTILDKTLIGVLITDTYQTLDTSGEYIVKKVSDLENGYYEQSEKIVKMIMTIITSIGIVMIPRNSNEFSIGNISKVKENVTKTARIVLLIGVPMTLGLIAISDLFVPWFFGPGYDKCSLLIRILSPLIVVIGLSNVFGLQFLIPSGNDKKFTIALLVGAVTNFILNIVLIKYWWSVGASIATIIAEIIVTFIMCFMCRKEVNLIDIFMKSWKYYLSGLLMFSIIFIISKMLNATILNTFLLIGLGTIVYFICLLVFRDDIFISFMRRLAEFIKKRFIKKN